MAPHLINRRTGAALSANRAVFIERRAEALVRDARNNPITGPMAFGWVSMALVRALECGDDILAKALVQSRNRISAVLTDPANAKETNSCATE